MISRQCLSQIKQIPIIEVAKRLGIPVRGRAAMCFMGHDKASPSLSFHESSNTWRCFGACGKHGDGINLVMEMEGVDFNGALEWFAQNFSVDVPRRHTGLAQPRRTLQPKKSVLPKRLKYEEQEFFPAPEVYEWLINHCGEISQPTGLEYLSSHSISEETAKLFHVRELRDPSRAFKRLVEKWGAKCAYDCGLAWGSDGRPERLIWGSYALLFPFYEQNKVIYIQARMFKGKAKYLNPRKIAKPIFNLNRLGKLKPGDPVHICEGVSDAMALESQGLSAVGILGATSFRAEWVDLFLKFKIVVLGDGDEGGATFANDISDHFSKRSKPVTVMGMPAGKDVSDVLASKERLD